MHTSSRFRSKASSRRGTTLVLTIFFLSVLLAFVALVVDLGYLVNARAEIQRSADSAAMAACWEYATQLSDGHSHADASTSAYANAVSTTADNQICSSSPTITTGDVVWGRLSDLTDRNEALNMSDSDTFNAVKVTIRRTADANGKVPFFFAKLFGYDGIETEATATAAIVRDIIGFQVPADNSNLGIMPFALDEDTWNAMLAGSGSDSWKWNGADKEIESGSDGLLEMNLYPQGTGAPGNRGTVDIGSSGNSTNDLARQIVHGISPSDMAHHNGRLEFDANGELFLNGDTGISAGIKDELKSIKGQPRTIPIFREVHGPGNNAEYTIVKWVGIRILDVKLTGSKNSKRVTIQVAPMLMEGVIPSPDSGTSSSVFSPVVLVR